MRDAADDGYEGAPADAEEARLDRLVTLLREQPAETTFAWNDDTEIDDGVLTSWLDVWAPQLARPLGVAAWVWTIRDPGEFVSEAGANAADVGPLTILLPYDAVTRDGVRGWLPGTVSHALESWARTHAGRDDLRFERDPNLTSDWISGLTQKLDRRDGFDAPLLEDPSGVLHQIVEQGGVLRTRCGRLSGPEWPLVEAGLWVGRDWDEDKFEREMARGCDACEAVD